MSEYVKVQNLKVLETMRPFISRARVHNNFQEEFAMFQFKKNLDDLISKLSLKQKELKQNGSSGACSRLMTLINALKSISDQTESFSLKDGLQQVTEKMVEAANDPALKTSHHFLIRALLVILNLFGWRPKTDQVLENLRQDLEISNDKFFSHPGPKI